MKLGLPITLMACATLWIAISGKPEPKPLATLPPVASLNAPPVTAAVPSKIVDTKPSALAPPAVKAKNRLVYVSGSRVAFRKEPNPNSEILDRLNDGFAIMQIERSSHWVKVKHPLTQVEGYVTASRLRDTSPPVKEEEIKTPSKKETATILATSIIVAKLIEMSVADYRTTRPCACPYNETRTGASCGGRSAWSRPGGAKPLCYPSDVTPEMVAGFRAGNR